MRELVYVSVSVTNSRRNQSMQAQDLFKDPPKKSKAAAGGYGGGGGDAECQGRGEAVQESATCC